MDIKSGYFFIADISGYTRFLTSSELDHATEILDALFDSVLYNVKVPITIVKAEGDAICFYIEKDSLVQTQSLIEAMEQTYFNFRRRLELMFINSNCKCNACANMMELDLKIFLHYGEYLVQQIGGKTDLQGAQVILIHRLMKNRVKEATGCKGYGLLTEAAVSAMGLDGLTKNMIEHFESYEHYGDVRVFIHDLGKAWELERERQHQFVSAENCFAKAEISLHVPASVAWPYVLESGYVKRYFTLTTFIRKDTDVNARIDIGSAFHCQHELTDIDYVIVDLEPPDYLTSKARNISIGLYYLCTIRIIDAPDGSTFQILFGKPEGEFSAEIASAYQGAADGAASIFAQIIDEEIKAGKIQRSLIEDASARKAEYIRPSVASGRFANIE